MRTLRLAGAEAEEVVHVGDVADFAHCGLEAGDIGELVDLTTQRDHTVVGPDADAGGEVAEAQRESDPDAVGEGVIPVVGAPAAGTDVDRGSHQVREPHGRAPSGGATARAGAGMEEKCCECDDCGAAGGRRELEDPGHERSSVGVCGNERANGPRAEWLRRPPGCRTGYWREPMKRQSDRTTTVIIAAVAVLAAGITLYQLTRPGFLFGITPDISAWFGGSIRLVHGALPYRDFDLLQPPGFALLASPFAFLSELIGTRDALAVLRLCTPLIAAGNVLLVGKLVRHHGRAGVIVACGVMAFFPAELYAIRSGLLEPVVDLFCLAGTALVFDGDGFARSRRRILAGGIAFGIAGTVKAPAILPVLVIAVLCAPEFRDRLLPFLGGVVAGFGIPTVPFVLAAPGGFIRDVIGAQLARIPAGGRVSIPVRLGDLTGVGAFGGGAALALIATIVLAALVTAAFVARRRKPAPLEWFAIAATFFVELAQLGPASYYEHYAAFSAPFLGILLGISLGRLVERRLSRVAIAVATVGTVALLVNQVVLIHSEAAPDIAGTVDAVVPAGGCALSDAPSKLVTTDRFVATSPGCTVLIDPAGATLAYGYGSAAAEGFWTAALEHADYLVTSTPFAHWYIPPDPTLRAYVAHNFRLLRSGGLLIYVRDGFAAG